MAEFFNPVGVPPMHAEKRSVEIDDNSGHILQILLLPDGVVKRLHQHPVILEVRVVILPLVVGQDERQDVLDVLHHVVGLRHQVFGVAYATEHPDAPAELGVESHAHVGLGVTHHRCLLGVDVQVATDLPGIVGVGLGKRVGVIAADDVVDVLAQLQLLQRGQSSFPVVRSADGDFDVLRFEDSEQHADVRDGAELVGVARIPLAAALLDGLPGGRLVQPLPHQHLRQHVLDLGARRFR